MTFFYDRNILYHFRISCWNAIRVLLSAAISLNRRRRHRCRRHRRSISCPPRWSGIPIAPAHFFSTLNTVSSVGVQLRESVLPQNTKMWCSISAKNISAFINVDSTAILFIFWNWKTWYNLQRRIEKYLQQKHLPELHNGAQWIGKNQWFLYDIMHGLWTHDG